MSLKIIDNRQNPTIRFEEIKEDECFMSKSGGIFKKVSHWEGYSLSSSVGKIDFSLGELVTPVSITITIEKG